MKLGPFDVPGYYVGDSRALLKALPDESVNCVVTSPPYWGLRDYNLPPAWWGGDAEHAHDLLSDGPGSGLDAEGVPRTGWCPCGAWLGQLGLEPTIELFLANMVEVFDEVWRVLRSDGVVWANMGDSYVCAPPGNDRPDHSGSTLLNTRGEQSGSRRSGSARRALRVRRDSTRGYRGQRLPNGRQEQHQRVKTNGFDSNGPAHRAVADLAPKNLVGAPWRLVFELQAAGWIHRGDVVWSKLNPMPEAVKDRPTRAHEYLFMLTKTGKYWYDAEAVKEPSVERKNGNKRRTFSSEIGRPGKTGGHLGRNFPWEGDDRNLRSVWTLASEGFTGAHFATFPRRLVQPCVLSSCPPDGLVLDPFMGSGTVARVAEDLGRRWLGFDLSPAYAELAKKRTAQTGLLTRLAATKDP